ncbi:ABC transporter substrate-binding protein [Siccirubricoccus deserti]|uniref:Polyamine ABC transporter substrate-binding protein n=1 Tax=Siccirubricoccus deserti TaxID=2013562 RepID=A0A9X0QYN3_9PROT|nr:polyamine ABC transporter substrate-binding protein [Siccirubricoccus deserti]MBC4016439.1 polyamine ABC transporter substrate-binding protein [Siccirubricoccus deserti]GGC49002.1 ABC transporter substrate-binding protein [Siccirubricoccus deserti]
MAWAQRRFEGRRITYVSWGGAYQDGQKKAYCDPFTEMTGLRIDQDGPNDYAKLRLMVSSGRVVWDVADVGAAFMQGAEQQNLFEKLDYEVIDRSRIDPRYVTDHGVGNIVFSYNLAYSTERFAGDNRPQRWADLWDLKRFPGKRMLNANAPTSLEAALLADGVAPAQLYPLDVSRALRKLDQIKEHIIWWETNSQSQQILVSGAATMGLINNGRLYDAVQKGAKLALSWEQAIQSVDYLVIPRGSRNLEPATALIDYVTRPEPQAAFANLMVFSPTNPAAFPLIRPELHGWLATNPAYADKVILQDGAYWRDNLDAVNRRWNAWRLT